MFVNDALTKLKFQSPWNELCTCYLKTKDRATVVQAAHDVGIRDSSNLNKRPRTCSKVATIFRVSWPNVIRFYGHSHLLHLHFSNLRFKHVIVSHPFPVYIRSKSFISPSYTLHTPHTYSYTTAITGRKNTIQVITSAQAIIKVSGHQHRWLAGGYDQEIGHFRGG